MIKVLLIEDHDIVRDGMEQLLSNTDGLCVVGSAGTGKEGIKIARDKTPQVVVLDFELPDTNGLEVTRKLLRYHPDTKILIMSAHKNETMALQLFEAGAAAFISKDYGFRELHQAIRTVHLGQRYMSSDMVNALALRSVQPNHKTRFDELSPREMEIALCVANGLDAKEIATRLHIAKKTVHTYRYRVFEKLHVKNDLELLRFALQSGVVTLDKNHYSDELE